MPRPFLIHFVLTACLALSAQAGTFKNPLFINTSYDPVGLAVGDFNRDGKLDLVYVDGSNGHGLHVLLGRGDGTFSHGQDMDLPSAVCGYTTCVINVADINRDGILDLVIGGNASSTAQVGTVLGNGDGTFRAPVISTLVANTIGNSPYLSGRIAIGDIDEDGAVDLVVGDQMNSVIWVAKGDNSGKFTVLNTLRSGYPISAYLADLNGDGHLDIITLDRIGAVAQVNLGNGNGTFQPGVDYSLGASTQALYFFDLDADGHPDVVAETYPSQISVLKGYPDGSFAPATTLTTVPSDAELAGFGDFNGDATTDLIFLDSGGIGVVLGNGNLAYGSLLASLAGPSSPSLIAYGDFNQDGHADLALGVESGIIILNGTGNGTFVSADVYDVGVTAGAAAVADFNGDKFPDIAVTVSADYPRLLLGNGLGQFALAPDQNSSYSAQPQGSSISVADFNGDGKKDLVAIAVSTATPYGGAVVLFGQGDGTFKAPIAVTNGSTIVGDLNSDGKSDMVSATFPGTPDIFSTLGAANDTFISVSTPLRNPTFASIFAVGDLNHDGKPDLVINGYTALEVWLGNGDGTFTYHNRIAFGAYVAQQFAPVADLDGDGNADMVVLAQAAAQIIIFYGNGDGTFHAPVVSPVSHALRQIVVSDVNRDNKPDLVLTDGAGITVMTNLGNRVFSSEEHYVSGQGVSQLNVVDVNGDGFPDIITACSGTKVSVLLNQPNGTPPDGSPTTGVLSINPEPSNYGQSVNLAVTLSGTGPVPTGLVSFNVDGNFLADAPLASGTATYTYAGALAVGEHTFVATYSGDKTYQSQSLAALHHVLAPVYSTQTTLVAAPTTLLLSQTVRLTATVTSSQAVTGGFVTFSDGANTIGSELVNQQGIARFDTSLLAAGTHHIDATYQGLQGSQQSFSSSTSAAVTVTVTATKTATALSASSISPTAGTIVTFTGTVTSSTNVFGAVTFYDDSTVLGTTTLLSDGTTTFSTASLSLGTHTISAVFGANGTFASSTSAPLSITVSAAVAGAVPAVVSMASGTLKQDLVLTAEVWTAAGSPRGKVTFLDSGSILGTSSPDVSGVAMLNVGMLSSGHHELSASFDGAGFAPAVSPELREQWPSTGRGFSLNFGASVLSITESGSEAVLLTVLSSSGFQRSVKLSCQSGVPIGYACVFTPASVKGGGGTLLKLERTPKKASSVPLTRLWFAASVCFLAVCLAQVSRHRRPRLVATVAVFLFSLLLGCGSDPSPRSPNMRVLSVQASSGSGQDMIIHSAQLRLNLIEKQ